MQYPPTYPPQFYPPMPPPPPSGPYGAAPPPVPQPGWPWGYPIQPYATPSPYSSAGFPGAAAAPHQYHHHHAAAHFNHTFGIAPHGYAYGNGAPAPVVPPGTPGPSGYYPSLQPGYGPPTGMMPPQPPQSYGGIPPMQPPMPYPGFAMPPMPSAGAAPSIASAATPILPNGLPVPGVPSYPVLPPNGKNPSSGDSGFDAPTSGASSGEGNQHRRNGTSHNVQSNSGGDSTTAMATQPRTGSSSDHTSRGYSNPNTTGSGSGGASGNSGGSGKGSSDSGNSADARHPSGHHHQHQHHPAPRHGGHHSSTGSSGSGGDNGGSGSGGNGGGSQNLLSSNITFTETHPRHPPTGSTRHGRDFSKSASNQAIAEQRQLIVKFLTDETSDDQLRALFEQFGPVDNARQVIDKKTGHTKGFGFVTFVHACDAVKALHTMRGYQLCGRQLNVALAQTERNRDF